MAKSRLRPALLGPPILRTLSRIDPSLSPAAAPQLPVALSQWIDWNRAVTLAAALDSRPAASAAADTTAEALAGQALEERASTLQRLQAQADALLQESSTGPFTAATLLKGVVAFQRAALVASGRLRGTAREAVAARNADGARLAELDAVMEQTLAPREARLLERLTARALAQWAGEPETFWPDGLPAPLRSELRALLQADLDLRFQPVEGLLSALRPH